MYLAIYLALGKNALRAPQTRNSVPPSEPKSDAVKTESTHGCEQDPGGFTPGTRTDRRSDHEPGTAGSEPGTTAGQAAIMACYA